MTELILQVRDLTIGYNDRTLYGEISFDIFQGDFILLCGANGSGKTTLLKTLAGRHNNVETIMVPTRIPKVKGFTLKEFISLSCAKFTGSDPEMAMDMLSISDLAERDISTLSDGEFQKATIAAALARRADIILLDEPTAFLDAGNRRMVLQNLKEICSRTGTAIIFSSHDLHESISVCSKVIALGADGVCRCTDKDMEEAVSTIFAKH